MMLKPEPSTVGRLVSHAQPVVIKSLSDLGELTLWHFI
jgi:hypothetical protein